MGLGESADELGPFDPANFFENRIQRTRLPARLTRGAKPIHRSIVSPIVSVASFTAHLTTNSFGDVVLNDEQHIVHFEAPGQTVISRLEPEGTIEGWVEFQYRFLTWHYASPALNLPVSISNIFGVNTIEKWPAAPTVRPSGIIETLDDEDNNFCDLDCWFSSPSVHQALIPATMSELACPGFNANGTQMFLANAVVPNFQLEVQETFTGSWHDAEISSFSAIEDSTNYRAELEQKPQIRVGFEYRVIGWKAKPLSED